MIVIRLYSSQLSTFIGRNPHSLSVKVFNKLFNTFFKEFQKTEKFGDISRSDGSVLNEFGFNLKLDLDTLVKKNLTTDELREEKNKILERVIKKSGIDEERAKDLEKIVEGYSNKGFGTNKEISAIEYYKENINSNVYEYVRPKTKTIFIYKNYKLEIISKLDSMTKDGEILEFKNRMYRFFEEVKEYEWLQVQTYLEVYNLEKAQLVEYLKKEVPEMKINKIKRDKEYWQKILFELKVSFKTLIDLGITDLSKYLQLSEKNQ